MVDWQGDTSAFRLSAARLLAMPSLSGGDSSNLLCEARRAAVRLASRHATLGWAKTWCSPLEPLFGMLLVSFGLRPLIARVA